MIVITTKQLWSLVVRIVVVCWLATTVFHFILLPVCGFTIWTPDAVRSMYYWQAAQTVLIAINLLGFRTSSDSNKLIEK